MADAALPETLTHREARATLEALEPLLRAPGSGAIVLDASPMRQFDSSAIALLLACRRRSEAAGRTLQVANLPPSLVELAGLYGVDELLPTA